MAERIAGIALMPRESRNGVYYDVEELKKFDGKQVPLRVEHDKDTHIGEVTFEFDQVKSQVMYEAEVFDTEWQKRLDGGGYQVSIGASVLEQRELCDEVKAKCLNAPVLNEILELSVVKVPGIPESTLTVIESDTIQYIKIMNEEPTLITSIKDNGQNQTMTTDIKSEKITENVEEKVKVTIETDGEVEVEKPTEAVPAKEEAPVETPKETTENIAERIEKSNDKTLKAVIETVKDAWTPKSEVAEAAESQGYVEEAYTEESAKQFLDKVFETGYGRMVIDKEGWIESNTGLEQPNGTGSVHEAVSTSGTIPGVKQTSGISIQLGSKTAKPVRQFGKFQAIPTGQNTARFYRITVPDAGAITESTSSDITATTHTLTSIDVTCSVRGWRQTVLKSELEDYPGSFLNALRETARLEAVRDEHKLIVEDLAGTDHDYGGVTTAPYHISGTDGSAVGDTAAEDATGEFDEDGITFAKRYLEELGQDTSPGKLVAFISPRAFESLITSSSLSEYTMVGNAGITRLGQLERLYGVDIVVSNEIKSDVSNSYRNLVCVKGAAFGLCSQRNMEIEFQKQIAGQYWDIVWTHRIGVDILDPNTYVIVSSKQD
uniref:Prohead protease n=1 Tax=Yangshan Harbor Nitrososphaeria virus TaxID=2969597 RepID=A0A976UB38_9CAUD|nr:prohead protease [Yangshan Harbor Nitrososphaeria virus]